MKIQLYIARVRMEEKSVLPVLQYVPRSVVMVFGQLWMQGEINILHLHGARMKY